MCLKGDKSKLSQEAGAGIVSPGNGPVSQPLAWILKRRPDGCPDAESLG